MSTARISQPLRKSHLLHKIFSLFTTSLSVYNIPVLFLTRDHLRLEHSTLKHPSLFGLPNITYSFWIMPSTVKLFYLSTFFSPIAYGTHLCNRRLLIFPALSNWSISTLSIAYIRFVQVRKLRCQHASKRGAIHCSFGLRKHLIHFSATCFQSKDLKGC